MSIQDDMFDVSASILSDKGITDAFDRLMIVFGRLEADNDVLRAENSILKQAIRISTQPPIIHERKP